MLYGELSSSEQRVVQCLALSPSSLSHEAVVALTKAIAIDGKMLFAALATIGCIAERRRLTAPFLCDRILLTGQWQWGRGRA